MLQTAQVTKPPRVVPLGVTLGPSEMIELQKYKIFAIGMIMENKVILLDLANDKGVLAKDTGDEG
mgnify:CR=1 FL=1